MHPNTLISLIAIRGLRMPFIPGGGRPEWTAQEAAMACQGLPPRIYDALVYTYAGDHAKFWDLSRDLYAFAKMCGQRWHDEAWVRMHTLTEMVLLEVSQPWRFKREENSPYPDLRRVICGVDQKTWARHISPAYEALTDEFVTWLQIGSGRMRRRLHDDSVCAID